MENKNKTAPENQEQCTKKVKRFDIFFMAMLILLATTSVISNNKLIEVAKSQNEFIELQKKFINSQNEFIDNQIALQKKENKNSEVQFKFLKTQEEFLKSLKK